MQVVRLSDQDPRTGLRRDQRAERGGPLRSGGCAAISAGGKQAGGRGPVGDSTPMPSRVRTYDTGKPQRKKSVSGRGPWGVVIRRAACSCLFGSLIISRLLRLVPSEYQTNQVLASVIFAAMGVIALGVLLTLVSFVGASVSFMTGNNRAFASESMGEMAGWLVACLLSLVTIVAFGYGYTHPTSKLSQSFRSGGGVPGGFPAGPPPPVAGAVPRPGPDPAFLSRATCGSLFRTGASCATPA